MNEMNPVMIRPIAAADVPAVAQMEQICFGDPWSEKSFYEIIEVGAQFFIAESHEDGAVIPCGFAGIITAADESQLLNIAVLPDFRGRGIAKSLMAAITDASRAAGAAMILLEVRVTNDPARALYEKEGFTFCGIRKNYYQNPKCDAAVMVKYL